MSPHEGEQTEFPTMRAELSAEELYNLALGETLWPEEKRTIYCSVTGKPWGKVTEAYVKETVLTFGSDQARLTEMVDRMTLFNGPSPLWQAKVANMLVENKQRDPAGFCVYLLTTTVLKRIYEKQRQGNLEFEIGWRKAMTQLYRTFTQIGNSFLDNINDALLNISAEGYIAQPHQLPSQNLLDYADRDMLVRLVETCKKQYRYMKSAGEYYGRQVQGAARPKNFVHGRTVLKDGGLEQFDEITARRMRDLQLLKILRNLDIPFSAAEKDLAKRVTGVASPILQELKRIEFEHPELVRQPEQKPASTHKVLRGQPVVFSFGKKQS